MSRENESGIRGESAFASRASGSRSQGKRKIILTIAITILVVAVLAAIGTFLIKRDGTVATGKVNQDGYQAVFLTNGQVYFGKLDSIGDNYLGLSNIYYLQADSSIQSGTTAAATTTDTDNAQLVKLGNELHGPEDEMQISAEQVLFWENLKKDGKVAQAIENYKKAN